MFAADFMLYKLLGYSAGMIKKMHSCFNKGLRVSDAVTLSFSLN